MTQAHRRIQQPQQTLFEKTLPKSAAIVRKTSETKPVRPLTIVRRTQTGPQGQPEGTYTCYPPELDDIVEKAWERAHAGNDHIHPRLISTFVRKHAQYNYTAPAVNLQPLTGPQLKE